jgi:hypothetical protein
MGSDCCGVNKQYITNNFLLVIFTKINNISFNVLIIYLFEYRENGCRVVLIVMPVGNQKIPQRPSLSL